MHLSTQVFVTTDRQLAAPTEKGPATGSPYSPRGGINRLDRTIVGNPRSKNKEKNAAETPRVFHLKNCSKQTLIIYVFHSSSFS